MSTRRRTAGIYLSAAPKGPNGERLCRNCHGPMPKGARHNCSPRCSGEWQCRTSPGILRQRVFDRDRGVCSRCGTDTNVGRSERMRPIARGTGDRWQADHIIPVVEGGGECTLANMRTLCTACHKLATAELARRRARDRADQKRGLLAAVE